MHTGRTSMHISVHVRSGDLKTDELDLTTHCLIVFVALDESREPKSVPKWHPRSDEDFALGEACSRAHGTPGHRPTMAITHDIYSNGFEGWILRPPHRVVYLLHKIVQGRLSKTLLLRRLRHSDRDRGRHCAEVCHRRQQSGFPHPRV